MISHDTTDQVTNYRRAPTRKNQLAPSFLPITAMEIPPEKDTVSGPELLRRRVRRVSMEGAAEIRRKSAEEYEFRMAAGARMTAVWRKQRERPSGSADRAPALTVPEEHHRRDEVEPGQVLIKLSEIRPIKGTTEKTLRALAIHMVHNQLAGPYAGINPEEVNAVGKPGEMIPVRVEFTLGKEIIPAVHNKARAYPLQQVYEAQRAKGNLNKQLYVRMRLPSDVTEVGPVPELVMEVPEAEWTSPAGKKTASRINKASPPEDTRPNPHTGSPAKKHKPTKDKVSGVPKSKERLTVWCRLKAWTWTRMRTGCLLFENENENEF